MKKYLYRGELYTIKELENHKDCKVTSRELRKNIWKRKLSVEKAMITQNKKCTHLTKKRWYYHGLELTLSELADLQECRVSYWVLQTRLRQGVPVEMAFIPGKIEFPEKEIFTSPEVVKKQEQQKEWNLGRINRRAAGSSISFKPPFVRKTQTHTYYWLVCEKLGLEMNDFGVDMEKYVDKWITCH